MQLRIIMSLMQENFEHQMQFLRASTFSATRPPSGLITTSAKNLIIPLGVRFGPVKRLLDSIDE
jgi:hypothetical protein